MRICWRNLIQFYVHDWKVDDIVERFCMRLSPTCPTIAVIVSFDAAECYSLDVLVMCASRLHLLFRHFAPHTRVLFLGIWHVVQFQHTVVISKQKQMCIFPLSIPCFEVQQLGVCVAEGFFSESLQFTIQRRKVFSFEF